MQVNQKNRNELSYKYLKCKQPVSLHHTTQHISYLPVTDLTFKT